MKQRSKPPLAPEVSFSPDILARTRNTSKKPGSGDILVEPAVHLSENPRIREVAERQLLYDVAELTSQIRSDGLAAAITGGLATRAYTGPIRFTHDADMVVSGKDYGRLKRILKDMGYRGSRKEFGKGEIMFATRHIEERRKGIAFTLKIDVSVGGIYDHSSGIHYPMDDRLSLSARNLPIRGFYPTSSSVIVNARVISLEDLFILKVITVPTEKNGREKDTVDALLLALKNPPDLMRVWDIARQSEVSAQITKNISMKLLPFLLSDDHPTLMAYGLSFSDDDKEVIRSYLSSLLAHREFVPDPKSFL